MTNANQTTLDIALAPNVTVADLLNAFHDVLDGVSDHDLHSMTGMSIEICARIIEIRQATNTLWLAN